MALSNYTELQAAVRTELAVSTSGISDAAIVDAINRAEAKINRRVRCHEMESLAYATYEQSSGSRYLATPSRPGARDLVEMIFVRIKPASAADTEYVRCRYVTPQKLWKYYNYGSSPQYFTLRNQLEFNLLADQDYTVMMHYYGAWDIATDATNWLLTHYPDIYLYGALAECEMHRINDERVPLWHALFGQSIEELNERDAKSKDDDELETEEISNMVGPRYRYSYNILRNQT